MNILMKRQLRRNKVSKNGYLRCGKSEKTENTEETVEEITEASNKIDDNPNLT